MFSCEICEIFKNTFFYRTPLVAIFENKHTHASAADLLHIRIGSLHWNESYEKELEILTLRKCRYRKNKSREIDCLCCREMDGMLIASAEILERERSILPCSFKEQLPVCFCFWCWSGGMRSVYGMEWNESKLHFATPGARKLPLKPTVTYWNHIFFQPGFKPKQ